MYCTRCGKKIDYDAFVCNECLQKEEAAFVKVETETAEPAVQTVVVEEPVATATEEPTYTPFEKTVDPQPTYSAPNNQQYYYTNPNTAYTPYQTQPPVSGGNPKMRGFGKALTSAILSFASYIFSAITNGIAVSELPGATVVFLMMTLGMAIPALIMGIKSITTFTSAGKQGQPRPIATLILGIVGVAMTAITFLICFIAVSLLGMM